MNALTIGLLLYVGLQLAVGIFASRKVATEQDYLLAGRSLGPLLGVCSVFATWFGAEACVGAAGRVYSHGLGWTSVEPFAYGLALVLVGVLLAVRLWRAQVTTFPDLLRRRYSPAVERLTALLHIPGSILWAAAQVRAFGQVLSSVAEIDIGVAVTIAAAVAIAYTTMGGLLADVVTDFMQGGVLVLGLAVVTIAVLVEVGGVGAAIELAQAPQRVVEPASGWRVAEAWLIPIGGSLVSQEVLARTLASRSAHVARVSAVGGGIAYLLVGLMPVAIGLVGAGLMPGLADGEDILPRLVQERLHPVLYVVFVGALISAILSTVDSSLLVAGSLLSRNVLHAGRDDIDDRKRLLAARAGVVLLGVVAWFLALGSEGVFELVEQASGFGSAGMAVVLLFGLFTRVGGPRSALAALTVGLATWIGGRYVLDAYAAPYLTALAASAVAYVLVIPLDRRRAAPERDAL